LPARGRALASCLEEDSRSGGPDLELSGVPLPRCPAPMAGAVAWEETGLRALGFSLNKALLSSFGVFSFWCSVAVPVDHRRCALPSHCGGGSGGARIFILRMRVKKNLEELNNTVYV
jgi:hypothetical protein